MRALHQAVKPDPAALEFAGRVACVSALAAAIRRWLNPNPPDIAPVMRRIGLVPDESITGHEIRASGPPALDLSRLDFSALVRKKLKAAHVAHVRSGEAKAPPAPLLSATRAVCSHRAFVAKLHDANRSQHCSESVLEDVPW